MNKLILISACLIGENCRYDGSHNLNEPLLRCYEKGGVVAVCPEVEAGLSVPREPCEILTDEHGNKKVITKSGVDQTDIFNLGAVKTLAIALKNNIQTAVLKHRSPSCGCGLVYDGHFNGNLIAGNGITADLLLKNDISVYTEQNFQHCPIFKPDTQTQWIYLIPPILRTIEKVK